MCLQGRFYHSKSPKNNISRTHNFLIYIYISANGFWVWITRLLFNIIRYNNVLCKWNKRRYEFDIEFGMFDRLKRF